MRETLPPTGAYRGAAESMRLGAPPRESAVSGIAFAAACLATVVCVTTVVATARSATEAIEAPERRLPALVAGLAFLGIALVVAAIWAVRRQRPWATAGLSLAVVAAIVPLWSSWPWLGAGLRAAVLALPPLAIVGVVLLVGGWHGPPRGGAVYRRAGVALGVGAALVHLLGYDPFSDLGCARTCERVTPLLAGILSTRSVVALASALTVLTAIAAVAAILRALRDRRTPAPIVGAAVVAVAGIGAASALRWATWGEGAAWSLALILQPALVALVAAAVCLVEGRSWRTRVAVDRVVARLSPRAGPLALGGGIHDVHFAVPGTDRWVDAAGRDVGGADAGSKHVVLTDDAVPILRLVLARGVEEGDVLAALTPASRLALRNAQLSALAMARVLDVRESQRRVVAATDAERRRIERDLHDGAQQRLIGVSFQLSIARARVGSAAAASLERADRSVRDALGRLRELAHGMFPRVLAEDGLEAAVEELVSSSPLAVTLDARVDGPTDPEVAMAAYATVAATLRSASVGGRGPTPITVTLERIGQDLVVTSEVPGAGANVADFADVADRVGAAGGRLSISTAHSAIIVSAVIPSWRPVDLGAS